MKKLILIIASDPNSINYEILSKSVNFFKKKNKKNRYLLIGNKEEILEKTRIENSLLNILDIKKNKNISLYLEECFKTSFKILKKKKAHGIINLPLNKKFLPKKYSGFTEYISDFFKIAGKETMLLYNENFSVCPNTTHIPLAEVSNKLTKKIIIKNVLNINNFYKKIFMKNPRIGILGFNPHNGQDFFQELEEEKTILPSIKHIKKKKIKILGPISPDVAFNEIKNKKIDCLVGNYHDQVLPTFKYINKFNAINITLGLPFFRISPDHGTAENIIGKNLANPSSFLYALNFFEKHFKKI
jgi:4-hydroxy-L-threonine phosphate dehydrogenase PdxA